MIRLSSSSVGRSQTAESTTTGTGSSTASVGAVSTTLVQGPRHRTLALATATALASLFASASLLAALRHSPARFNDSETYLHLSFVGHAARLWTVPLLYTALPDDRARIAAQTIICVAAWLTVAWQAARWCRRPWLRWAVAVALLGVGLSYLVQEWNNAVLSESLAISTTVLVVAAWLRYLRRPDSWPLAALLATTALWIFTRQVHALIAVVFVVPFLALAWRDRRRLHLMGAAGVLALTGWGLYATAQDTTITRFNTANIIADRMLTDPDATRFYVDHGLPTTAEQRADAGRFWTHQDVYLRDPTLVAWIDRSGQSTYIGWLAHQPVATLVDPARHAPGLMTAAPACREVRARRAGRARSARGGRPSKVAESWSVGRARRPGLRLRVDAGHLDARRGRTAAACRSGRRAHAHVSGPAADVLARRR